MIPSEEGKTHINAYSKSKTRLGYLLSNFARTPFHCEDGRFESIEGYWYWLSCAGHPERDELRRMHGYMAKKIGREMRGDNWPNIPGFQAKIKNAIAYKINQTPELKSLLQKNHLPIVHYYTFGTPPKVVVPEEGKWIWEFVERIQRDLQLSGITVRRGLLTNLDTLQKEAEQLNYRPVPHWLGSFQFHMFGKAYGRQHGKLPPALKQAAMLLWQELCPEQHFTTVFVQRYRAGESVLPHADPRDNTGHTIIGVFGRFTGATNLVHSPDGLQEVKLHPGDVLVQPCTINGRRGPKHEVTPVESGVRYALILNTIE